MKFFSEVIDDPHIEVDPAVVQQTKQEASPPTYKSTSLSVQAPALGTVPAEEEKHFDDDVALAFLGILEDTGRGCLFDNTPKALKLSHRNGRLREQLRR